MADRGKKDGSTVLTAFYFFPQPVHARRSKSEAIRAFSFPGCRSAILVPFRKMASRKFDRNTRCVPEHAALKAFNAEDGVSSMIGFSSFTDRSCAVCHDLRPGQFIAWMHVGEIYTNFRTEILVPNKHLFFKRIISWHKRC
jgi:hypothetical protein